MITASNSGIIYGNESSAKDHSAHRSDLLNKAQRAARAGVSETVRKGLELLAAGEAYDGLLKMRGKVKFSINLRELRED